MKFQFKGNPDEMNTGNFTPLLAGVYELQIVNFKDSMTKTTNRKLVNVELEVIDSLEHNGRKVFHNVTFIESGNPGHGMCLNFLKIIGQPFEGDFEVDTDSWIGKRLSARLTVTSYQGKPKNEIKEIIAYRGTPNSPIKDEEKIPF